MVEIERFKPVIIPLIRFYYEENPTGGPCHIVLDEGSLEIESLLFCKKECGKYNDHLGCLIMETLLYFTEDERKKMYETDWWGMRPVE